MPLVGFNRRRFISVLLVCLMICLPALGESPDASMASETESLTEAYSEVDVEAGSLADGGTVFNGNGEDAILVESSGASELPGSSGSGEEQQDADPVFSPDGEQADTASDGTETVNSTGTETIEGTGDSTGTETVAGTGDNAGTETVAGTGDSTGTETVEGTGDHSGTENGDTGDQAGTEHAGDDEGSESGEEQEEDGYETRFIYEWDEDYAVCTATRLTLDAEDQVIDQVSQSVESKSKTTKPTCEKDGLVIYTAQFDAPFETQTAEISNKPALGHTWEADGKVAATCVEKGYTKYHCTREGCGATKRDDYTNTDSSAHLWKAGKTVAPTCVSKGYTVFTCSRKGCDAQKKDDWVDIDPEAHSWGKGVKVAPTCVTEGYTNYVCKNEGCGAEKRDHIKEPVPDAHVWVEDDTVAPTCVEKGYTVFHCSNPGCDAIKQDKWKNANPKDHLWTEDEVVLPTCVEKGYTSYRCINPGCDAVKQDHWVKPDTNAHVWIADDTVPPTCVEKGYTHYYCANPGCDETMKGNWLLPIPDGHVWKLEETVEPTCVSEGYTVYRCANFGCEETKKDNLKDAVPNDHRWNEGVVSRTPTCTEQGVKTFTCLACGATMSGMLPAAGHLMEEVFDGEEADENGLIYHVRREQCRRCNQVFETREGLTQEQTGKAYETLIVPSSQDSTIVRVKAEGEFTGEESDEDLLGRVTVQVKKKTYSSYVLSLDWQEDGTPCLAIVYTDQKGLKNGDKVTVTYTSPEGWSSTYTYEYRKSK